MVTISEASLKQNRKWPKWTFQGMALVLTLLMLYAVYPSSSPEQRIRGQRVHVAHRPSVVQLSEADHQEDSPNWKLHHPNKRNQSSLSSSSVCQYSTLSDLTPEEWKPTKGKRHMVQPPLGGKISLVCCDTTAGPLNIAVHHKWAPKGAERFMEMVTSGFLGGDVPTPMMRCIKNFLCQFGLSGDPNRRKDFQKTIEDEESWLPKGPDFRQNEEGVNRFAQGYLAYAGSGRNSRNKQLIMALKKGGNGPLGGGSPWEVPWGELVGEESFETLEHIYTGYGEKGPGQHLLLQNGMNEEMKKQFPDLSYLKSCQVMDERIQEEEPQLDPIAA